MFGKEFIKTRMVALMLPIFLFSQAYASREAGNGGDGILINGKVYAFDLVEYGLHKNPYINENTEPDHQIISLVEGHLWSLSEDVRDAVAKKFAEIKEVDEVFYQTLVLAVKSYSWSVVEDFSLVEIHDEDGSDLNIPKENFRQVAVRSLRSIKFDKFLLEKMDRENIAATVFHEIVYSIIPVKHYGESWHQSSRRAREITGYMFSPGFPRKGLVGLYQLIAAADYRLNAWSTDYMMSRTLEPNSLPVSKHSGFKVFSAGDNDFFFRWDFRLQYGNENFAWNESEAFGEVKDRKCVDESGLNFEKIFILGYKASGKHKSYETVDSEGLAKINWYLEIQLEPVFKMFKHKEVWGWLGNRRMKSKSRRACLDTYNAAWNYYISSEF